MTAPARAAAHRVLRAVHTGRADLPRALTRNRDPLADPRDRALATEIATGTLRMRNALDYVLADVSSRPLQSVDADALDLLRAAAYQLLYLDRVPSHAVVHDAVALTRTLLKPAAAGFVNAVLRALTAARPATKRLPQRPTITAPGQSVDRREAVDYLTTTLSHPRWLAERWIDRYGFARTERWASFNNTAAPITLRVNTLKTDASRLTDELTVHGVDVVPGRWSSHTLIVTRGNPLKTPLVDSGKFVLQDEASQLVAELVAARPGDRVIDTCAAPGGKTVAIAGTMSNTGMLVAGDLRPKRLALLARTLARCGCHARVVRLNAQVPLPFPPIFDWVLVDAPCSGLGTLRRDPDIRWRRQPDDLAEMAATQSALLTSAAAAVSPGGRLVYATCSSEPEENHDVVERFLGDTQEFTVERPTAPHLSTLVDTNGYFQTLPHRDGLDSFFAAVLHRHRGSDTPRE